MGQTSIADLLEQGVPTKAIQHDSINAGDTQEQALQRANITEQILRQLEHKYQGMTINGIEDKAGLKTVHDGRMYCRSLRISAQKICKAGREDAIQEQKRWINAEQVVTQRIRKVEDSLKAEEDRIKAEKERIRKEKAEREARRIAGIIEAFAQYGRPVSYDAAASMSDEEYVSQLEHARQDAAVRQQQEERIQRERQALEAKQRELEEREQEAREAEERIRAAEDEKKRMEEAARAVQQARMEERQRIAREQAETEARRQEEAEERKAREKAEREAALLQEQQRPDREKLEIFAEDLQEIIQVPDMKSPAGQHVRVELEGMLQRFAAHVLKRAAEL